MTPREVPRNPDVPTLSNKAKELLTKLCFRRDDNPEPVDLIFVYSGSIFGTERARAIEDLLNAHITKKVFLSGGIPHYADSRTIPIPEWQLTFGKIDTKKFPDVVFYHEEDSTNTLENVTSALRALDFKNYKKVFFIFKSFAAGRGYLTLRKFLPNTKILQRSFPTRYPEAPHPITRDNWHTFPYGLGRIWGEFLRIEQYGERGDIAYEEIKEVVAVINREVNRFN